MARGSSIPGRSWHPRSSQATGWRGLAAFSTVVDTVATAIDPLGSLIAAGLGWLIDHFEPVKSWFNDLTGDAGAVAGFSQTWTNVQNQLNSSADYLDRVVSDLDDMAGEAIEACRRFQTDAAAHIRASGQWAGAMATGCKSPEKVPRRTSEAAPHSNKVSHPSGDSTDGTTPPHRGDRDDGASAHRGDDDADAMTPVDNATPEQIAADLQALRDYTGPEYVNIKKALRGEIPMTPELREKTDAAVRAMDRLPDHRGTVIRGEKVDPGATYVDAYQTGKVVTNASFTSADKANAFDGNVFYTIESLHGKSVRHISNFASTEDEVLFRPGTQFHVTNRYEQNGKIYIDMRELP